MQLNLDTIKKLPISEAAAGVVQGAYDRMPRLVIDRSLEGLQSDFVADLIARVQAGFPTVTEVITMPRRGFGPRPITITDGVTRTLLTALVNQFGNELSPGRTPDRWTAFDGLGRPFTSETLTEEKYVVVMDIASCYEYIDHALLVSYTINSRDKS